MSPPRAPLFAAAALLACFDIARPAAAADLGGSCCADLEERIAELEATTAHKGSRKVSLTISGWVGQQITWWDDGTESNTYVHDLGSTLGSHLKLSGGAQVAPGFSAGYVLHLEGISSDGLTIDQDTPRGPPALGNSLQVLQSYWFLKSDRFGTLSLGKLSQASDNTAILVDGSGSLIPANWVSFDVNSFFVRNAATGALSKRRWGEAGGCTWGDCNGVPLSGVRYDSPSYGGFSFSMGWGEDDFYDYAVHYAREIGGFKFSAAAAYSVSNDLGIQGSLGWNTTHYFQAGAYLEHIDSGLFGVFNYGNFDDGITGDVSSNTWWVKGGVRRRWNPLGITVLYGEYLRNDDGGNAGSRLDMWGLGAVQDIDMAAMSLWVKFRQVSADGLIDSGSTLLAQDFRWVGAGALINF